MEFIYDSVSNKRKSVTFGSNDGNEAATPSLSIASTRTISSMGDSVAASGTLQPSKSPSVIEGNNTLTSPSNKKNRSSVWANFEKLKDANGNEIGRAKCIWCENTYQSKSEQGTSGLWKHLRETCKKCPIKKELTEAHNKKETEKGQKLLSFQSKPDSETGKFNCWKFDQEAIRAAFVRMVIKDELSFKFVEGEGFKEFIEVAIPMFHIPSRFTIARDCFALFIKEKKKLKALLQSNCQRVSFTTDTWTSIQNVNYLVLTAHFIDANWNMHKRILNFCVIKSHKGVNIGNAVDFCMDEWGLNKVMCITIDNASSNDTAVQQLKKKLLKKNAFVLSGDAFHMRCFAHILQLIVRDGLEIANSSVAKICDVVKYVRSSPQRLATFKKCCEDAKINSKASVQLDCPTRWNSTYLMLDVALTLQAGFDKLEDADCRFVSEFGNNLPSEKDWNYVAHFCKFLKRFYDVTCKLSGSLYSTSNLYFPEIMKILKDLETFQNSHDLCLIEMEKQMREKFDKYWGSIDKMNVMLFIAVVLDPRYKMKYLSSKYKIYYSEMIANDLVHRVTKYMRALIEEYRTLVENRIESSSQSRSREISSVMDVDEDIDDFFLEGGNQAKMAAEEEFDRYLEEFLEKYTHDFDIFGLVEGQFY